MKFFAFLTALVVLLSSGCASYTWKSNVPNDKRTVFVSAVRNESEVLEMGNVLSRQLAREFQREGTYKLSDAENCALEVQCTIKVLPLNLLLNTDRESNSRRRSWRYKAEAIVSFIDKKAGKVLVDNRKYEGYTSFYSDNDLLSAKRGASGRIAEDIARQIVDDALDLKWE